MDFSAQKTEVNALNKYVHQRNRVDTSSALLLPSIETKCINQKFHLPPKGSQELIRYCDIKIEHSEQIDSTTEETNINASNTTLDGYNTAERFTNLLLVDIKNERMETFEKTPEEFDYKICYDETEDFKQKNDNIDCMYIKHEFHLSDSKLKTEPLHKVCDESVDDVFNESNVFNRTKLHPCVKENYRTNITNQCPFCKKCFMSKQQRSEHRCGKYFDICSFCGKFFPQKLQFLNHFLLYHFLKVRSSLKSIKTVRQFQYEVCSKIIKRNRNLLKDRRPPKCEMGSKISKITNLKSRKTPSKNKTKDTQFRCEICQKSFTLYSNLKRHAMLHTGERPFSCNICLKSFTRNSYLKNHIRVVHDGERLFACKICAKMFPTKIYLNRHILTHNTHGSVKEKSFTCELCSKRFTTKYNLNDHIKAHIEDKSFICEFCSKGFISANALKKHLVTHTGRRQCQICKKMFAYKYYKEHMRIHTGEKPFSCEICSKTFKLNGHLKVHMNTHASVNRVHENKKTFDCEVCSKTFKTKNVLKRHLVVYTGEKRFHCELCEKKFSENMSLKIHMRIHTGEKPYTCKFCNKSFKTTTELNRHMVIHPGGVPFKCDICKKTFRRKDNLKIHMRIHTGERFSCKICSKSFTTKSNLNTHVKKELTKLNHSF